MQVGRELGLEPGFHGSREQLPDPPPSLYKHVACESLCQTFHPQQGKDSPPYSAFVLLDFLSCSPSWIASCLSPQCAELCQPPNLCPCCSLCLEPFLPALCMAGSLYILAPREAISSPLLHPCWLPRLSFVASFCFLIPTSRSACTDLLAHCPAPLGAKPPKGRASVIASTSVCMDPELKIHPVTNE